MLNNFHIPFKCHIVSLIVKILIYLYCLSLTLVNLSATWIKINKNHRNEFLNKFLNKAVLSCLIILYFMESCENQTHFYNLQFLQHHGPIKKFSAVALVKSSTIEVDMIKTWSIKDPDTCRLITDLYIGFSELCCW